MDHVSNHVQYSHIRDMECLLCNEERELAAVLPAADIYLGTDESPLSSEAFDRKAIAAARRHTARTSVSSATVKSVAMELGVV